MALYYPRLPKITQDYPSGRIAAHGFYAEGTTTRVCAWNEFFDQGASPKQWDRSYTSGSWDPGGGLA